ncbi:MAG: hypothetical protein IJ733_16125 [Lachnospiraceae bacterium]|nr:hypothetical protein [Lachnospiraceae bacterium]
MKQYVDFTNKCKTMNEALIEVCSEFRERCKRYCVDEEMQLYRILLGTEIYDYEAGTPDDFAGYCCDKPDWSIKTGKVQWEKSCFCIETKLLFLYNR